MHIEEKTTEKALKITHNHPDFCHRKPYMWKETVKDSERMVSTYNNNYYMCTTELSEQYIYYAGWPVWAILVC